MPMAKLSEMLGDIRDKSKYMSEKPDFSNQEKLVTELIRIDSDDSDSENNMLSSNYMSCSSNLMSNLSMPNVQLSESNVVSNF